jgi:hypothetical protein
MALTSIFVAAALAIGIGAQGQHEPPIKGSGNVRTETRNVGSFTKVRCDGFGTIEATIGPRSDLKVTADDNILGVVKTRVDGDTLVISCDRNVESKNKLVFRFSTPVLRSVEIRGAADVKVDGLRGGDFDVRIAGAGKVAGRGSAEDLRIEIAGAGTVLMENVDARSVDVSIPGTGNASVRTNGSLKATVNGVGNVKYYGNPRSVSKHVNGMGNISAARG